MNLFNKIIIDKISQIEQAEKIKENIFTWNSPSNIALVKYWGKQEGQIPRNPSISFTLSKSFTQTEMVVTARKKKSDIDIVYKFEKKENDKFAKKIQDYFLRVKEVFPFVENYDFEINSFNTFPHSAGIASSASFMSSLSLCLCSLEEQLLKTLDFQSESFFNKASYLARIGSGSACRSLWGGVVSWEKEGDHNSYLYGKNILEVDEIFKDYRDAILLVDTSPKAISSSQGHKLMDESIYADTRYKQASDHHRQMKTALKSGDLNLFGTILEKESLGLHGLMLTSNAPYCLLKPNSIEIIGKVIAFRKESKLPLYFTLDAGPNIHLLYPLKHQKEVEIFIENDLKQFCESGSIIYDSVGAGPTKES